MEEKLYELLDEFADSLTLYENQHYVYKIRDYLIPYLIKNKHGINAERIFKEEFTRMDIINSAVYYVEENEDVESLSAVNDFLIAVNRFFEELLFEKYSNPTLMTWKPFAQLSGEVLNVLKAKGIELKTKETDPAINFEQYRFIVNYLKNPVLSKTRMKKFTVASIAIKVMLLYGISYDRLTTFLVGDYCIEERTLDVKYMKNGEQHIYIEFPYALAKELQKYLEERDAKEDEFLLMTLANTKLDSKFLKPTLDDMRNLYYASKKENSDVKNQFTPTGLQKYAIIQMILAGMNQSIIMDFTGQKNDIYNDCQNEVNLQKQINRNRYVNQIMRGIATYDEI